MPDQLNSEVLAVAKKFVLANCYDPEVAMQFFDDFLQFPQ